MSRNPQAPAGFTCPYRHNCPHLEALSTTWVMEVYQESFELRNQLHQMEQRYEKRIAELERTLKERDAKIAQLQVQHQKQFKADKKPTPVRVTVRPRGAPLGHPGWRCREPDHVDVVVPVAAPSECRHCGCVDLLPSPDLHVHTQEDIVLVPRTRVTRFEHKQCLCPKCRRAVYRLAAGELAGCVIGPVTRAVAIHLRYDLQIPYRKVQHVLKDLFGMPLVPASAMNFDRQATRLGLPLYEDLKAKLQSAPVVYGDETSWREDGEGHFVWFAGNDDVAVYRVSDNRAAASAVELLGDAFDGALVTDDYAAWNAVGAADRQTCWNHLRTKAKEVGQQVEVAGQADPPVPAPRSAAFCRKLRRFAVKACALGRQKKGGRLSLRRAKAMVPALERELARICGGEKGGPLENAEAETLRQRVMVKDRDKLFTFLRVKGVEPTNNHAERSLRFLVIMRKVCFGTRSAAGSESHGVLPSLLQTARRQGKEAIGFLLTLLTKKTEEAKSALFAGSS